MADVASATSAGFRGAVCQATVKERDMQAFDIAAGDIITDRDCSANNIPGMGLSVRTDLGSRVTAWRAAPGVTQADQRFFCHGYTLGTYGRFGYTVFGVSMPGVLADEYQKLGGIGDALNVAANDILVWWQGNDARHSAIIVTPGYQPSGLLDTATTVVGSKTGTAAIWTGAMLTHVKEYYQAAPLIEVYRRS